MGGIDDLGGDGGVDGGGFDGVDGRVVASMVGVEWWTVVFDTEGTDVEVPQCPQWSG